jgi:hypothetical protein
MRWLAARATSDRALASIVDVGCLVRCTTSTLVDAGYGVVFQGLIDGCL